MHTLETIIWKVYSFKECFCISGFGVLLKGDSFWRSVISRKFGLEEGGWCTRKVRGGCSRVLERDMGGIGDCSLY